MTAFARRELRTVGVRAGAWVRGASYLPKWLVLGSAIGVIAGLGAVAFYWALTQASQLLLGVLGGYTPPAPAGEGGGAGTGHFTRWWVIPLVVAGGGLLSGLLVFGLAPEAEGHGTDAAIDAVHKNPRMIRARAVIVKLVSSAITIGSGGSGGREGPTAQISAGFGSLLARTLDLSPEDGRIAVSVGIGSGIGAIFGAPLGGAVLAADIVYKEDFESEALVPGLVASIVAYTVFGFIDGFHPLFGYAAKGYEFHQPIQLLWFAVIGVLAGAVGLAYSATFYGTVRLSDRLRASRAVKPALGGLLVGLLGLAVPQALGTGYGWVQHALNHQALMHIALWIVLLVPLAKIVATSLSIGTGGSGGIFGPGMVIGAFVGAAVWRLLEPIAPGVPHSPAAFVIVGMMACFGSIARAPLAMMLMVAEMTGSLAILAPAMIAVGLAYLIVRQAGKTIYVSQLRNRAEAQAARLRQGLPLLARVPVQRTMQPPRLVLPAGTRVTDAAQRIASAQVPGAPVVDDQERFIGTVAAAVVAERAAREPESRVSALVDPTAASVTAEQTLDQVVDALPAGQPWLTVVNDQRRVEGVVALSDIVRGYRRAVRADANRLARIASNASIFEYRIGPDAPAVGNTIVTAGLPEGTILISLLRGDTVHYAAARLELRPGDVVTVLARADSQERVAALFGAESADGAGGSPADGTPRQNGGGSARPAPAPSTSGSG
ncbi:MAG TPA: chloride channel protein [Jatrophihabitans sp.]|nr:chloride channel protein [Jatrophihabitans sp.]